MDKKNAIQTISWFYDLYKRDLLELNPPYQRKSVWNQKYKDYYIDTLLLHFPCPAIFLYEEMNEDGLAKYFVVDGKQRLTTIFEFIENKFPAGEKITNTSLQGKYFQDMDREIKVNFFRYNLTVEYLMTTDETIIHNIFERINKNIAKLTPQELRHAGLDGEFITQAEEMTEWMSETLPNSIPRITRRSINQMKDVEYTSSLFLLIEEGANTYLQEDLDRAYSNRDIIWDKKDFVIERFKGITQIIKNLISCNNHLLLNSRIKNQADLYAIYGAINKLYESKLNLEGTSNKINDFYSLVDNETEDVNAKKYYDTIRSNTNFGSVRQLRIELISECFVIGE